MPNAATPKPPSEIQGADLERLAEPIAIGLNSTRHNQGGIVQRACAQIAADYRRAGFSAAEAFEQARYFADRAAVVAAGQRYQAELDAVAEAMR